MRLFLRTVLSRTLVLHNYVFLISNLHILIHVTCSEYFITHGWVRLLKQQMLFTGFIIL
jgi:hypothetical protein